MSRARPQAQSLYGTPGPLSAQNPSPVIAKRDPTNADVGYALGQNWVNKVAGTVFELATVSAGLATWVSLGTTTGSFATVNAATFNSTTAARAVRWDSGNVWTFIGTDANGGFTLTPKGAGGLTLTTGALTLSSGALSVVVGNATLTNGNLVLGTAGKGISVKAGANARIGQSTLVAGTIAVANTSVTANTRVFVTRVNINASVALGVIEAIPTAGVGFTINSYDLAAGVETDDVSIIDWFLVESA